MAKSWTEQEHEGFGETSANTDRIPDSMLLRFVLMSFLSRLDRSINWGEADQSHTGWAEILWNGTYWTQPAHEKGMLGGIAWHHVQVIQMVLNLKISKVQLNDVVYDAGTHI